MTFLLKPLALLPAMLSSPNGGAAGALADPQPKIAWETTGAGAFIRYVDIDLGADMPIDTVAMLFHNGLDGGVWAGWGRADAGGALPAHGAEVAPDLLFAWGGWGVAPPAADALVSPLRRHALAVLPAVRSVRRLRIGLWWPGPGDVAPFRCGVLALGQRLEPGAGGLAGFDWGTGQRIADLSEVRVTDGGERAIWRRAAVPEVRGSFSHLTDAERQRLLAILRAAGESGPLLLVESADTLGGAGLPDRIHYGTLSGLDFLERRMAGKSRIELRLRHWL